MFSKKMLWILIFLIPNLTHTSETPEKVYKDALSTLDRIYDEIAKKLQMRLNNNIEQYFITCDQESIKLSNELKQFNRLSPDKQNELINKIKSLRDDVFINYPKK